jgi:hypothetical protein
LADIVIRSISRLALTVALLAAHLPCGLDSEAVATPQAAPVAHASAHTHDHAGHASAPDAADAAHAAHVADSGADHGSDCGPLLGATCPCGCQGSTPSASVVSPLADAIVPARPIVQASLPSVFVPAGFDSVPQARPSPIDHVPIQLVS